MVSGTYSQTSKSQALLPATGRAQRQVKTRTSPAQRDTGEKPSKRHSCARDLTSVSQKLQREKSTVTKPDQKVEPTPSSLQTSTGLSCLGLLSFSSTHIPSSLEGHLPLTTASVLQRSSLPLRVPPRRCGHSLTSCCPVQAGPPLSSKEREPTACSRPIPATPTLPQHIETRVSERSSQLLPVTTKPRNERPP